MVSRAALVLWMLGCGARPHAAPATTASDEVTLYRDRALVMQRVDVVVPPADTATIAIKVAAGIGPDDLVLLDRGELVISELRVRNATERATGSTTESATVPVAQAAVVVPSEPSEDPAGAPDPDGEALPGGEAPDAGEALPGGEAPDVSRRLEGNATPTELELVVGAPHEGRFTMALAYATDRLAWDVAYTMTTTAIRDRASLRGAVAIRNTSGIALHARTYVVDAELGAWREHAAEQLGSALAGRPAGAHDLPLPHPRDLGLVPLGDGETRVELLAGDPPRKVRSVLVYDPIGPRLDHPGSSPISDPAFGVETAAPARIIESLEIDRAERATRGLPAGPVRLLERRPDGSLAVLGESRLFDAATRIASVDTVALGAAEGVTGRRERRDWAKDSDQRRFSEEFLLTIDNARPRPIEIVLREHLYRGQNWTIAYQSAPAVKEGSQQISLRAAVPANGQAKVFYVVVYTW